MKIITNYAVSNNKYRPVFKSKVIRPKKTAALMTASSAAIAGCANMLLNGVNNMETKKFIDLREDFSKKLEPATIEAESADWDFYTNSTDENMEKSQIASDNLSAIFQDEETYKKFLEIDSSKLPKHEAKQLKDILKSFDDELNTGEAKKALRDKESEIAKKYNSYVPMLNGKEVTRLELARITEEETNPQIRKQAYEAKIAGGDLIAEDLKTLAKMRNEYAKSKGYKTYFDYMIKESYDVESEFLDQLIDEVYSLSKDKIKVLMQKREKELQDFFKTGNLENYHYGLLLESDPENAVNEILENNNIEDITKQIYLGMGYDMDKMVEEGKLILDLYPRKNKNTHGFCFGIDYGKDSRILANLRNNYASLETLCHEMGHCVYNLGILTNLPFFDKKESSSAYTEAVAMMMQDLPKRENVLKDIIPSDLLEKFKSTFKEDEAYFVARCLEIIEFERDMYRNPDQDLAKLWQEKRNKYMGRNTKADNEWATIPHYLSHPGYYQNYFRAALMKAQMYNHLVKTLGFITENKNSALYMDKNIFSLGATLEEYDLIKQLTGKDFSSKDFAENLE